MKLDDVINEIFHIAIDIEYKNISYFHPLLAAKNNDKPEDLLTAIAAPIKQSLTNGTIPNKAVVTAALRGFRRIAKTYRIKELKQPIKQLEAYLEGLA